MTINVILEYSLSKKKIHLLNSKFPIKLNKKIKNFQIRKS